MSNRIEIFTQMLEDDPGDTMVMFGLANEHLKAGNTVEGIEILERYLKFGKDEGAGYGMLAKAYQEEGETEKAKKALEEGIQVSISNGHPTMAEDYRFSLETEFD